MAQADNWRDRYLDALDAQEQLEQLNATQAEQMRRITMHLSAAAAGLDDTLDEIARHLKEALREVDHSAVATRVDELEREVRAFVEMRQGSFEHVALNLSGLISSLRALSIDRSLRQSLAQLDRQVSLTPLSLVKLPALLQQLLDLQQGALEQAAKPAAGLWQRLRGQQGLSADHNSAELTADFAEPDTLTDLAEPSWESARASLQQKVQSILDELGSQEQAQATWQRAQERVNTLADWQQLGEVLGDVHSLLNGRDEQSEQALSRYLNQLNQDLQDISEQLGFGYGQQQSRDEAAHIFGQAIANRVAHMHSSVDQASDLTSLKDDIRAQVEHIQGALESFRRQQQNATPFAEQLQLLLGKVRQMEREAAATQRQLAEQSYRAHHDALTELPNRESYNQRVKQEFERFQRYGRALSMALVDIDHFKQLNDQFGHQVGDRVLKVFAQFLRQRLRNVDFIARYGGEEFIILMPETDAQTALELMDRTREAIVGTPFRFKSSPVKVSFSCGVSSFACGDDIEQVLERADRALYEAKGQGRNRIVMA